ncbi:hypothetical protein RBB50_008051 [Rhinocladiella similis]
MSHKLHKRGWTSNLRIPTSKSFKIAPPTVAVCAFVVPPTSNTTISPPSPPTSPRPLSPRSYQSHPITIKDLPDSSCLLSGPRLSPPPPIRFRALGPGTPSISSIHQHKRARSAPTSLGSFVLGSSSAGNRKPSNGPGHNRTKSAPELTTPTATPAPSPSEPTQQKDAIQLCDRDHRDHPVRGAGDSGLRNLRGAEPSQPLCQEGKGTGRRRGMTRTLQKVRFQLDDDIENIPHPPKAEEAEEDEEEDEGERTVSGLLRLEDERDSWF